MAVIIRECDACGDEYETDDVNTSYLCEDCVEQAFAEEEDEEDDDDDENI